MTIRRSKVSLGSAFYAFGRWVYYLKNNRDARVQAYANGYRRRLLTRIDLRAILSRFRGLRLVISLMLLSGALQGCSRDAETKPEVLVDASDIRAYADTSVDVVTGNTERTWIPTEPDGYIANTDSTVQDSASQDSSLPETGIDAGDTSTDSASPNTQIVAPALECSGGELLPDITILYPPDPWDPISSRHLVVKDSYIYFVKEWLRPTGVMGGPAVIGSLFRIEAKCGASAEDLELQSSFDFFTNGNVYPPGLNKLVNSGDFVYWASNELYRVNVSDLSSTTLNIGDGCISDIAANDTYIYVYDRCNREIVRGLHGQNNLELFTAAGTEGLLTIGNDAVYFSSGTDIRRKSFDASPAAPFYSARGKVLGLNSDERAVVVVRDCQPWISGDETACEFMGSTANATVTVVPQDGSAPQDVGTMVSSNWSTAGILSRDRFTDFFPSWITPIKDGQVYIREVDEKNVTRVTRIKIDTNVREPVLRRSYSFMDIQGERMFWTEGGGILTALPQVTVPAGPETDTMTPLWTRSVKKNFSFVNAALSPDNSILLMGVPSGEVEILDQTLMTPYSDYTQTLLVKLTDQGQYAWSQFISPEVDSQPLCITVDPSGRISAVIEDFSGDQFVFYRFEPDGTEIGEPISITSRGRYPGYSGCNLDTEGNFYDIYHSNLEKWNSSGDLVWQTDITQLNTTEIYGFIARDIAIVGTSGVVINGSFTTTEPTDHLRPYSVNQNAVVRIDADGEIAWVRHYGVGSNFGLGANALHTGFATNENGDVLLIGETSDFVTTGNEAIWAPRPLERSIYMLYLTSDGSVENLGLLDGVLGNNGLGFARNGNVFLVSGEPARPFLFEPPNTAGNYIYGIPFAKLNASGTLVSSVNLAPYIHDDLPNGYLQLYPRLIVNENRVVIAATVTDYDGFPPWKRPALEPTDRQETFVAVFE